MIIYVACFATSNSIATWYQFPGSSDSLLAFYQGMQAIESVDKNPAAFYYWFDKSDFTLYGSYVALTSAHMWGATIISDTFPSLAGTAFEPSSSGRLVSGSKIVIMSSTSNVLPFSQQSLHAIGYTCELLSQQIIEQGKIRFFMSFVIVKPFYF